jgi:hypothetical protein
VSAAFTPGPWKLEPHAKFADTQMYWVNGVTSVGTQCVADARLIAAAPDLFYAVNDLLGYLLPRPASAAAISTTPTPEYAIAKARAALAKARGDQ